VKRVYICSRYAGDVQEHVDTAQHLCLLALEDGYAPFAPHLLYPQVLDDDKPEERELGMSAGLAFMAVCDEVWVYGADGISAGMRREIDEARRLGKYTWRFDDVAFQARRGA
jgi:hypothetical protein